MAVRDGEFDLKVFAPKSKVNRGSIRVSSHCPHPHPPRPPKQSGTFERRYPISILTLAFCDALP